MSEFGSRLNEVDGNSPLHGFAMRVFTPTGAETDPDHLIEAEDHVRSKLNDPNATGCTAAGRSACKATIQEYKFGRASTEGVERTIVGVCMPSCETSLPKIHKRDLPEGQPTETNQVI